MTIVAQLRAAAAALGRDEPDVALRALLAVWRVTRAPEVADAIDRVSIAVTARTKPIDETTVKARTVRWETIAKLGDPCDVGRLLAVPLPRTIKALKAAIELLMNFPDDPRIAGALLRFEEEHVITTWAGERLEARALVRIAGLGDRRLLPRLRTQRAGSTRGRYEAVIASLEREPTVLDDDAREVLEGMFDHDDMRERDLVAAILADPADRTAVAVYGDWLIEQHDPRGELIALQLGPQIDEGARRIRELVAAHGRKWAGVLDRYFVDDGRSFEAGFFAGGRLVALAERDVDEVLAAPGWTLVRTLEVAPYNELAARAMLRRPELGSLERAGPFSLGVATSLADGAPPLALRELSVVLARGRLGEQLATCTALPKLEALGLYDEAADLPAWCATAPVVERLARLALTLPVPATLAALAGRAGALRAIDIATGARAWVVRLQRTTAPGAFDRVVIRRCSDEATLRDLADRLARIPADWPRELVVESRWRVAMSASEADQIERALARFTRLVHTQLPWDRPQARASSPVLPIRIGRSRLLDEDVLAKAWEACAAFGQRYDSFTVNTNVTLRSLGKQPLARLRSWISKGMYATTLRRAGGQERFVVSNLESELDLVVDAHTYDDVVEWFVALLGLVGIDLASIQNPVLPARPLQLGPYAHIVDCGWLIALGRETRAQLDDAEVRALVDQPHLERLVVHATTDQLVLRLAPAPHDVTVEMYQALATALQAMLRRRFIARTGYELVPAIRGKFAALGFVEHGASELAVTYHLGGTGKQLSCYLQDVIAPRLTISCHAFELRDQPVPDAAALERVLHDAVTRARELGC